MHLHRAHLSPAARTRFVVGAAVLLLVALASKFLALALATGQGEALGFGIGFRIAVVPE